MNEDRTVADILEDAADYMDQHGKCINDYENERGCVCVIGAVAQVLQVRFGRIHGTDEYSHIFRPLVDEFGDLVLWSDKDSDKRRVVRGMRRVAKQWRREHRER